MAASEMDDLADRVAPRGVSSVFLYTREAHPGENYRHHQGMDDKRAHARAFQKACEVRRPILLDDLEGSIHRAYGLLPNMTWILGSGGTILYKAAWTEAADIARAIENQLELLARRKEANLSGFYSEQLAWHSRDEERFRAGLERAGPQAVSDFYGSDRK